MPSADLAPTNWQDHWQYIRYLAALTHCRQPSMEMHFLRKAYTLYGMFVFGLLFAVFFIPLLVPIFIPSLHQLVGIFNRWWAKSFFFLLAIPWSVEYRGKIDPSRQYIFAPNHFSYLDIPTMGLNKHNTIFVGKNDMESVPFFGWMYKKLHITVDRKKMKSRYTSLVKSMEAIDQKKSLCIFVEGGIYSEQPPRMAQLKDGAFRTAIEKQIPIVPVTIPYNWIILPENPLLLKWKPLKLIFHEPIEVKGMNLSDLDNLKKNVFNVIDKELRMQNPTTEIPQ